MPASSSRPTIYTFCAWLCALVAMVGVIQIGLVIFTLSILFTRTLIVTGWRVIHRHLSSRKAAWLSLLSFTALVVLGWSLFILYLVDFFSQPQNSLPKLFQSFANSMDSQVRTLPTWLLQGLQIDLDTWHNSLAHWVRDNSAVLQTAGQATSQSLLHIVLGGLIGWLLALSTLAQQINVKDQSSRGPLGLALHALLMRWFSLFDDIFRVQVRIAALNAVLIALVLYGLLPLFGIHLVWANTLVVSTFLLCLLPSIGTIVVAGVLTLVGLTESYALALYGLLLGLVLGKLEVLLVGYWNKKTVSVSVAEQLLVLIIVESSFGWSGVIWGPIFYLFIKSELILSGLL